MKLPFGLHKGKTVHISEVDSGKTEVQCPYCKQGLIAKKGRIKRHHFAHNGPACTPHFSHLFFDLVGKLPTTLPLSTYARKKLFKIDQYLNQLKGQETDIAQKRIKEKQMLPALKETLQELEATDTSGIISEISTQVDRFLSNKIAPFPEFHLIRSTQFVEGYTDGRHQCPASKIHEDQYEFFYPIAFKGYVETLNQYHRQNFKATEISAKLELFHKDLNYFNQFTLYFFEIDADFQKLYKIGLTSRPIKTRLAEIVRDLNKHYLKVELRLQFEQKGFSFLETFFKQKYAAKQFKIGDLTEYFAFSKKEVQLLLKDLNLLRFLKIPNRNHPAWIDWVYFNFNGKIYGHHDKCVYIDNVKYILTKFEVKELEHLLHFAKNDV